ncbi:hypothetical protein GCM10023320_13420 [Pseudonocardia adelaidensis]|uniref:Uncharacterized protein n=1 Tax=Pseudonocardia adelaidensis TaxID=648754 RepID=A0ABP9NFJ1_9PSEU
MHRAAIRAHRLAPGQDDLVAQLHRGGRATHRPADGVDRFGRVVTVRQGDRVRIEVVPSPPDRERPAS